ncbi:MAG: hypothetical protein WBQ46_19865, partial [Terriglobales bacterium]
MKIFLIILGVVMATAVVLLLALSATPVVHLQTQVTALGVATPLTLQVSDPHGIREAVVSVEQNGQRYSAWETKQPARRIFWQQAVPDSVWNFVAGTKTMPQLKDGKAQLIVEVVSNDFLGKTARLERDVTVVTQPPVLTVDSDQHYL